MPTIKQADSLTTDGVFGYVMSQSDNCLHLLRSIFPRRHIKWVKTAEQKVANNGDEEKNTRFDVWAQDEQGRIYDLEMQTTQNRYLGKRIRYYFDELDRIAIKAGKDYADLKSVDVIFFFPFDPLDGDQRVYHAKMKIEEKHRKKLNFNECCFIFNALGKEGNVTVELQAYLDYLRGKITKGNKFISKLDHDVKEYTSSPEWRHRKMNLAVKMTDVRIETEVRTEKKAMKKEVVNYRNLGVSEDGIFKMLFKDYGDDFTKEEIKDLIKKVE